MHAMLPHAGLFNTSFRAPFFPPFTAFSLPRGKQRYLKLIRSERQIGWGEGLGGMLGAVNFQEVYRCGLAVSSSLLKD